MIRDIISNDSLTLLLFGSVFFMIILKKTDPIIFSQNLSFRKNSHLVLKKSMEDLSVDEVTNYISNNKLLDKVK